MEKSESPIHDQDTSGEQKGVPVPGVKTDLQTPDPHLRSNDSNQKTNSANKDWKDRLIVPTFFMAIVALVAPWVSALATQQNAATAKMALEAAIQRDRLDQRGWVGIEEMRLVELPVVGKQLVFRIKEKNSGKTPGLKVMYQVRLSYNEPANLQSFLSTEKQPGLHVSPPGGIIPVLVYDAEKKPIIEEDVKQILQLRRPVYVYGIITYQDIFMISHLTRFCTKYIYDERYPTIPEWCRQEDYNHME